MADLFQLAEDAISGKEVSGPLNRINHELSTLSDDVAMVEAFSHCVLFRTEAGLLAFDASGAASGTRVVEAIRSWSKERIAAIVYTHGHVDHIGGSGAFRHDAEQQGHELPRVIAHTKVSERIARYRTTNGYNLHINARQFKGFLGHGYGIGGPDAQFVPKGVLEPVVSYNDRVEERIGDLRVQLIHGKGETDDHTWAWIESHKAICAGDFFIWNFPNAGNPQKVQRYPVEWAQSLRAMLAKEPEWFLPAHGLPIRGKDRIAMVLNDVATVLERLSADVLQMMNSGASLDDIVHTVKVPQAELEKPWLVPRYDEPEFVVRNLWRLYGGWWDGNPARLKPPHDSTIAQAVVAMAGRDTLLAQAANALEGDRDLRLAAQLVEWAVQANPKDFKAHEMRAAVYQRLRDTELSLMSKGIYGTTANESREVIGQS